MENKPLYEIANISDRKKPKSVCLINSYEHYIHVPIYINLGSSRPGRYISPAAYHAKKESVLKTRAIFKALKEHFPKEDFLVLEYYEFALRVRLFSKLIQLDIKIDAEIKEKLNITPGAGVIILFKDEGTKTLTKLTRCFGVLHDKL